MPQERNDLDVSARVRCAEEFDAKLMKLPQAPCLRPLVAEHWTNVEILLREWISRTIVLDEGTDRAGRPFRTQRQ